MSAFVEILGVFFLVGFCLLALVSLIFGLPGTLVIVGVAGVYAWATGFAELTWGVLAALAAMAAGAEALEFWAASAAAGSGGPSRRVTVAVLVGGLIGGIIGAPFFFGLGALPGALAGTFVGAATAVASDGGGRERVLATALAALRGRLLGFIAKVAIAVAMVGLIVAALF